MRVDKRSAFLLFTMAFAACTTEPPPPGCDICTTSAIVYGTVTTNGTPVSGARLRVEALRDGCDTGFVVGETNVTPLSASDGSYRDRPLALHSPFRACLRVTVTPPPTAGLSPRTVDGAEVEFRSDYQGGARDSVRVDVSLSP